MKISCKEKSINKYFILDLLSKKILKNRAEKRILSIIIFCNRNGNYDALRTTLHPKLLWKWMNIPCCCELKIFDKIDQRRCDINFSQPTVALLGRARGIPYKFWLCIQVFYTLLIIKISYKKEGYLKGLSKKRSNFV